MKAIAVFMVVCMILFSALAGSGEPLQTEIQKDCCQQMVGNMDCPHQKQDCGHGLCNLRVCHMATGFTAVNPVAVKLFKPLLKNTN